MQGSTTNNPTATVIWAPQKGPQKSLIDCPIPEILWGGARGGGKTDAVIGKYAIKAGRYGRAFNAIIFRRELPQADDLIDRSREIYEPLGARYNKIERQFTFPNEARVRFRPLDSVADAAKYQGQNLTDAAVEEAGNYPEPSPIDRLFGCLRSKDGTPVQLILTANPGGSGHAWIKQKFIDPAPTGNVVLTKKLPSGNLHRYVYIPSFVTDNKILLSHDPQYLDRLELSGSPALVRAWRYGDWSAVAGAYYPEFSLNRHVIFPCDLPDHLTRIHGLDWGQGGPADPFAVLWAAISDGTIRAVTADGNQLIIPRESLIFYREWYGRTPERVFAEQVAEGIIEREDEKIDYRVAGVDLFDQRGGPSLAERFKPYAIHYRRADTTRIAGWDQIRMRLVGKELPLIFIFNTCVDLIRTFPILQHDDKKPMDAAPGDDHCLDACRYISMARPWAKDAPPPPVNKLLPPKRDMNTLWEEMENRR